MKDAIHVHQLTKAYASLKVLKDLSFNVKEGLVYGFLGPNGAGKTTTIKVMLQLITEYKGEVHLLGERVDVKNSLHLRGMIGYLPQEPVFPEKFSGIEVMEFVAKTYHLQDREARNRIKELLNHFQLEAHQKRQVNHYSRGMKQRLGLAAALLPSPQLVILDEPASALDPSGRREVLDLIYSMRGKTTVFFSSHILADVEQICDEVAVLQDGEKLAESSVQELLKKYAPACYEIVCQREAIEQVKELLSTIEGITQITVKGNRVFLSFQRAKTQSIVGQILPLLVNNNIFIQEFGPSKINLEEVFFRILEERGKGGEDL